MALFNFPYINHGETPLSIQDTFTYLKLALQQEGHDVYVSRYVDGRAINIFFEAFRDVTTEILLRYANTGIKIVVIATETIINGTFNNFKTSDRNAGWYGWHPEWDKRYHNFMKVAEACKNVWCLSQSQFDDYASVLPSSWLHLIPYGYIDGYSTVKQLPDEQKDIDFAFNGYVTKRREKILNALAEKGYRVMSFKEMLPTYIRKNIISRTKICLGIRQIEEWTFSSLTRNYYHLMNRSFYLSETYEIPTAVDDYIEMIEPDMFVQACIEFHKRPNLGKVANQNLERYKIEAPLGSRFSEFLESSVTI